MNKKIEKILTNPDLTIKQVMERINNAPKEGAPSGIALIVNKKRALLGIVTDGDIRRAIMKGININQKVLKIMISDPIIIRSNISANLALKEINKQVNNAILEKRLTEHKVSQVVVVDNDNKVIGISSFYEIWKKSEVKIKNICIIGMGFVGLTLAVSLADEGFRVTGIENNLQVIKDIKLGNPHFHEKNLNYLLKRNLTENLFVENEITSNKNDIYIICVGTPVGNDYQANLTSVKKASSSIGKFLKEGDLVILRSTVPLGTCRNEVLPILEQESKLFCGEDFFLAYAPERTIEGKALEELKSLPQIIGGFSEFCLNEASNFFRHLSPNIVAVDSLEEAEMIKLVNNSFRDLSFAFSNELVYICDGFNLNVTKIIKAATEGYPRSQMPFPGFVGGYCLKKDPYIYANSAKKYNFISNLILKSREINEKLPSYVLNKIEDYLKENDKKKDICKIFLIGFAFKGIPETSDMRYSPTLDLLNLLKKANWKNIFGYDPIVYKDEIENTGVKFCSITEGFEDADFIIIMNNHSYYCKLDIVTLLKKTNEKCLFFDGWSLFDPKEILKVKGITYQCLGFKQENI